MGEEITEGDFMVAVLLAGRPAQFRRDRTCCQLKLELRKVLPLPGGLKRRRISTE
jgi:hypothetical protein